MRQSIKSAGIREKLFALLVAARHLKLPEVRMAYASTFMYCPSKDTLYHGNTSTEIDCEGIEAIRQLKELGYDGQGLDNALARMTGGE